MAAAGVATGERGVLAPAELARLLGGNGDEPAWQWFGGHAFAVLGDLEPLRELFEVEGCTVIRTQRDADGVFRLTMRQVTLYRDPASHATLTRWRNPYSGADTAVVHQHLPAVQATLSSDTDAPGYVGAWQLFTVWPEWLGMDEQPGYLFQRCFVRKLARRDELPAALRDDIGRLFADGLTVPGSG